VKKAKTKSRRAPRSRAKPAKKQAAFFEPVSALWARFAPAAAAGVTVVSLVVAGVLWSGGYFGLLGERLNSIAETGVVSAGFEVERITVKGLDQTNEHELFGAVGPVIGESILHFDPFAARVRVEELGWVRSAAVSRLLPNTVHVSIREREPAAVWQLSGALHLIDQSGTVIREIDASEYTNLPLIVGAGAPDSASGMLQALRAEPGLWGAVSALIRVGDRRWNLRLKSGADVKFPEAGYQSAVAYLAKLQIVHGLLDQPLEYIDLRDPERLIYREKDVPEQAQTRQRPAQ